MSERNVSPFTSLDDAEQDRSGRGACIVFDVHGLWWSVPTELTVVQVHHQMMTWLANADLHPILPYRPHQRQLGAEW